MPDGYVKCPECDGKGKIVGIGCPGLKRVELDCAMCKGSKTVTREALEWRQRGRAMRADRIARGKTLRVEAQERGLDPIALSNMERGIVEPEARV